MSAAGEEKKAGFLGRLKNALLPTPDDAMEIPSFEDLPKVLQEAEDEARARVRQMVEAEARERDEEAKYNGAEPLHLDSPPQPAPLPFPAPRTHISLGVISGVQRKVLTSADLRSRAPDAMPVEFVQIVDPMAVEELIREREHTYGIDLKEDVISADRAMSATLEKTIPRLHRELEFAYGRKREYDSKRIHWEWAEELRGQAKNASRIDRTLKKPKRVLDEQQLAVDKAVAEKRRAEAEMIKIQERLRKAQEEEQRARAGPGAH